MHHHSLPVQQDQSTVNGQTCHDYAALLDHQVQCKCNIILSIMFYLYQKLFVESVAYRTEMNNTNFYVVL